VGERHDLVAQLFVERIGLEQQLGIREIGDAVLLTECPQPMRDIPAVSAQRPARIIPRA
jgi:hypothetical protein